MEYCIDDKFYNDITELSEDLFETEDDILLLPNDYTIEVRTCKLAKIFIFTPEWMTECVNSDRFSEDDGDVEYDKIYEALKSHVNFEELNKAVPELYYSDQKLILTKEDFVNAL